MAELERLTEQAARRYAVAALTVFNAAAVGASPLEGLEPPGDDDDWDEPRLVPPAETGRPNAVPDSVVTATPARG